MGKVFKVCEEDDWKSTKNEDFFLGSKTDRNDGFIHFSTSEQLKETLEKYFKSKSPLYLLEVKTDDVELVWEISRNNQLFPHLYSPLPLNLVSHVYRIFIDDGGKHIIPEQVLKLVSKLRRVKIKRRVITFSHKNIKKEIQRILNFWFKECNSKDWFEKDECSDNQIKNNFGEQIEEAVLGYCNHWAKSLESSLVLIILTDQFTRNFLRGTPGSFQETLLY